MATVDRVLPWRRNAMPAEEIGRRARRPGCQVDTCYLWSISNFFLLGRKIMAMLDPSADDPRNTATVLDFWERAALAYWVLTIATGARFLSEASRAWSDSRLLAWIVVLGGLGQVAGIAIYFWTMWTRIRPVGSQVREAKGEKF